jgi:hypothetical protein
MKKNYLSLIYFGLFILCIYGAFSFDIEITPIKNEIDFTQTAQFKVLLSSSTNEIISIDSALYLIPDWHFWISPDSYRNGIVLNDSVTELYINAKPRKELDPKYYTYSIIFKSGSEEKKVPLSILILKDSNYTESYSRNVVFNSKMIKDVALPNENISFELGFENKNPYDVGDVKISISSNFFNHEEIKYLKPKTNDAPASSFKFFKVYSFNIPEKELPSTEKITILVTNNDEILYEKEFNYNVLGFSSFETSRFEKKSKYEKTIYYVLENKGSVTETKELTEKLDKYDKFFVHNDFELKNDSTLYKKVYVPPFSTLEVKYVVSYKRYYNFLFGFLIGLFVVFFLSSIIIIIRKKPLEISQEISKARKLDDSTNEINVKITLKNVSFGKIHNVKVKVILNKLLKYTGTPLYTSPDVINKKNHEILTFNIDELEKSEVRIIPYKVKTTVGILGKLEIPPADVIYSKKPNTKKKVLRSNSLFFLED